MDSPHVEVRRDDGELCGYVLTTPTGWSALTVFHAPLADFDDAADAAGHVLAVGLTVLRERWSYRPSPEAPWQVAVIVEAYPGRALLALDYYALPGVDTVTVTGVDLAAGAELKLGEPA